MKSHQRVLVWLTGLRENGHKWRWLIVLMMSLVLVFGGLSWQIKASTARSESPAHLAKSELFDSRTGAMLAMATNQDANANKVNQLSLALVVAGGTVGSYCWYRAKHVKK